ncbi:MAG: hypothetical protein GXO47_14440 [Chlorobi bacterium]|nr:hypothetical protein [Chlorobiota bacterium]
MTRTDSITLKLADWFMDFFLDPSYQYEPVADSSIKVDIRKIEHAVESIENGMTCIFAVAGKIYLKQLQKVNKAILRVILIIYSQVMLLSGKTAGKLIKEFRAVKYTSSGVYSMVKLFVLQNKTQKLNCLYNLFMIPEIRYTG